MNKVINNLNSFFSKGHARSLNAKKNVAITLSIKGLSILISILLVPLTINYISPAEFGIWLTISSFLTWFAFFDIGFGNGLKNKLAEAIALKDFKLAKTLVSTTYAMLLVISIFLLVIIFCLNLFLDWTRVLNAPPNLTGNLSKIILIVFSVFSMQFVFQLINVVSTARQNVIIPSIIGVTGNFCSLIIIYILSKTTSGSLMYLGLTISLAPLVVNIIFSSILYNKSYRAFSPSFRMIDLSQIKNLMGVGLQFFVIQIGLIFFYNADNLIISNIISPQAVTSYNIAFKYFSVITMIAGIVMAPFWPAFTDANTKKDYEWIRATITKLLKFCILIFISGLIMLVLSPFMYKLWIGEKLFVPFSLSLVLFAFTMINTYRTIFCFYLNGTGKIRLELYIILGSGLLNIPLGIAFGKLMGTTGVILATTILCFICAILETIQYKKLIKQTATGIWNK